MIVAHKYGFYATYVFLFCFALCQYNPLGEYITFLYVRISYIRKIFDF